MQTQDLAIVNIPLSRRGNIDAQIDRYKADQRRAEAQKRKTAAAQFKADKEAAKALWNSEYVKALAKIEALAVKRPEFAVKDMISMVEGWVKWEPAKFLKWMAA